MAASISVQCVVSVCWLYACCQTVLWNSCTNKVLRELVASEMPSFSVENLEMRKSNGIVRQPRKSWGESRVVMEYSQNLSFREIFVFFVSINWLCMYLKNVWRSFICFLHFDAENLPGKSIREFILSGKWQLYIKPIHFSIIHWFQMLCDFVM